MRCLRAASVFDGFLGKLTERLVELLRASVRDVFRRGIVCTFFLNTSNALKTNVRKDGLFSFPD